MRVSGLRRRLLFSDVRIIIIVPISFGYHPLFLTMDDDADCACGLRLRSRCGRCGLWLLRLMVAVACVVGNSGMISSVHEINLLYDEEG